jgi:hypothetical protein
VGRKGIHFSSQRINLMGNLGSGSVSRAFEHHVFNKMREAFLALNFVPTAHIRPHTQRYGSQ